MTLQTRKSDPVQIIGRIKMLWRDIDTGESGETETVNLVTLPGNQMYPMRALGLASAPAAPVGFKLGTGTTVPAVTGAGAILAAYLAGSNRAFDSGYPTASTISGTTNRITYQVTYPAGVATTATGVTISEGVLVSSVASDATSASSAVYARGLFLAEDRLSKPLQREITVIWWHDFGPAV
jgi:hypothetical protein